MTTEFLSVDSSMIRGVSAGGVQANDLTLPQKFNLFGIGVSAARYDDVVRLATHASAVGTPLIITALAVHGLMTGVSESRFGAALNEFDIVAPDGQPLRFALNSFYNANLSDRVYGPELTLRICGSCAEEGVPIYLYGSRREVVNTLRDNLLRHFPKLRISGCEPSIFRALTSQEKDELVERINRSGAGVLFVGLGCPLQEKFAREFKHKIRASQICVGAAFDFHAGNKAIAPAWMQRNGLEWLFRLSQEPGRLWRRYLFTNSHFVYLFVRAKLFGMRAAPGAPSEERLT